MNRHRLMPIALIVSLLANAFFIGYAAKQAIDGPEVNQRSSIVRAVGARLTRNLDENSREQVAVELDLLVPLHQENLEIRRENYRKLRELLAEPVIDRAAIDTVAVDMKSRSSDLVFRIHEKAIEAILELPAGTRSQIADSR